MVENGKKQKDHIYGRLLYFLITIFSNIIRMSISLFAKHLYTLIRLLSCLKLRRNINCCRHLDTLFEFSPITWIAMLF